MDKDLQRPQFSSISSGAEFNRWYWLKKEMQGICKQLGLPTTGSKFELRDRIMYALDNEGQLLSRKVPTISSRFDWKNEELTPDTLITDNISFGQNLREFMKGHLGKHFSFNTQFMAWAKENPGRSLQEAIDKWQELERQKKDPNYRSAIADHNMYNQYLRDIMDAHPDLSMQEVRKCWERKRRLPTNTGFIRFEP